MFDMSAMSDTRSRRAQNKHPHMELHRRRAGPAVIKVRVSRGQGLTGTLLNHEQPLCLTPLSSVSGGLLMPWLVSSHRDSLSPSQRECERTAFSFYCAVRERLPVWLLEDMRSMEVFCWDDGCPRPFLPSEALLYALVHDHRDYARYLLDRYAVSALRAPRCSFCYCGSSGAPHLNVAVRYDRVSILAMMVDALKDTQKERQQYLDSYSDCSHVADTGKTAVQLAVELSRSDCLLLLLVHGAAPDGLDAALQTLVSCDASQRRDAQRCLDLLLLFAPKPTPLRCLQDEPQRWRSLLGSEVFSWLCGRAPPPLLLQALRCLAQSGPDQISRLPDFLQLHS